MSIKYHTKPQANGPKSLQRNCVSFELGGIFLDLIQFGFFRLKGLSYFPDKTLTIDNHRIYKTMYIFSVGG